MIPKQLQINKNVKKNPDIKYRRGAACKRKKWFYIIKMFTYQIVKRLQIKTRKTSPFFTCFKLVTIFISIFY